MRCTFGLVTRDDRPAGAALRRFRAGALVVIVLAAAAQARADTLALPAIDTGAYVSDGTYYAQTFVTGISGPYANETRGLLAFDLTALPEGTQITTASLRVENLASANEGTVPPLLNVFGLPYTSSGNFGLDLGPTPNYANFLYIGSDPTTLFAQGPVPAGTTLPSFLDLVINAAGVADLNANLADAYYAYGMKVTLADAQEPKPLQFVFGGGSQLAAGQQAQLILGYSGATPSPIPEPASVWLALCGLTLMGRWLRRRQNPPRA